MRRWMWMAAALMAAAATPAVARGQEEFDMRSVTDAVDSLRQLRSSVESAPAKLHDVLFVSQVVYGQCYSKCESGPGGRRICSGDKGSYNFRFDVSDLKPRFNVPLNKQKTVTAAYAPRFHANLKTWADAVKRTSWDLDEAEAIANGLYNVQSEAELRSRRKGLVDTLEKMKRDLALVSERVTAIRQGVAGYLVQEGDARKDLESARDVLDERLSGLNQRIQDEMSRRACVEGPRAQYVAFQQTVTSHVNSIASVYDDVHMHTLTADRAGSVLLSETNRMTEHVGLVEEELKSAKDLVETEQALAKFHGTIAAKAWREYAKHVEEAVAK